MLQNMRSDLAITLGEAYRGKKKKVFDWDRAARLIKFCHIKEAWAGLEEDWAWTGGQILEDEVPIKGHYTFLSSTWATPVLVDERDNIYRCWCWEDECDWTCDTQWPESAIRIMRDWNEETD